MRAYETDYAGWAEDTALAIEQGRWSDIDRVALVDEVASLGKQERQRIVSRFIVLLVHMLKIKHQPMKATRSWNLTIVEQRLRARTLLEENPSLRPMEGELLETAYAVARLRAARETGLDIDTFPVELPFNLAEIWGE